MEPGLKIDYEENVLFYIVDKSDDPNHISRLSDEERERLEGENSTWIEEHLTPKLMTLVGPCACRMPEIMERTQRRALLAALPPNAVIAPTIEQEDVDAYRFVVVVVAEDDKYEDISLIIRECKVCSKLDFWGDSYKLGGQLAALINDAYTAEEYITETIGDNECAPTEEPEAEVVNTTPECPLGEGVAFEDLGSGEWSEGSAGVESASCGEPADQAGDSESVPEP